MRWGDGGAWERLCQSAHQCIAAFNRSSYLLAHVYRPATASTAPDPPHPPPQACRTGRGAAAGSDGPARPAPGSSLRQQRAAEHPCVRQQCSPMHGVPCCPACRCTRCPSCLLLRPHIRVDNTSPAHTHLSCTPRAPAPRERRTAQWPRLRRRCSQAAGRGVSVCSRASRHKSKQRRTVSQAVLLADRQAQHSRGSTSSLQPASWSDPRDPCALAPEAGAEGGIDGPQRGARQRQALQLVAAAQVLQQRTRQGRQ